MHQHERKITQIISLDIIHISINGGTLDSSFFCRKTRYLRRGNADPISPYDSHFSSLHRSFSLLLAPKYLHLIRTTPLWSSSILFITSTNTEVVTTTAVSEQVTTTAWYGEQHGRRRTARWLCDVKLAGRQTAGQPAECPAQPCPNLAATTLFTLLPPHAAPVPPYYSVTP